MAKEKEKEIKNIIESETSRPVNYVAEAVQRHIADSNKTLNDISQNTMFIPAPEIDKMTGKEISAAVSQLSESALEELGRQYYSILMKNIEKEPQEKRYKTADAEKIKASFDDLTIASVFERSVDGVVMGYRDYYRERGVDLGEMSINDSVVPNPRNKRWNYMLDIKLTYRNKIADIETDGMLHQGREENDTKRDDVVKKFFAPQECKIYRFRQEGNQMLDSSSCYIVSGYVTRDDKRKIIRCLNEFYGITDKNENAILRYLDTNLKYSGRLLLYGSEYATLVKKNKYQLVGMIKSHKLQLINQQS